MRQNSQPLRDRSVDTGLLRLMTRLKTWPKDQAKTWKMSQRVQATLRRTIIGGQWSQWRLLQHGYTNHGCCLQCMPTLDTSTPEAEEDDHRGQASIAESAICLRLPQVPPEVKDDEVQDEVLKAHCITGCGSVLAWRRLAQG
eukprot:4175856-Pyramimonas_sp.AAC.1